MSISREDLAERFRDLSDETLCQRYLAGNMTELALSVARDEMRTRGIDIPRPDAQAPAADVESGLDGDLVNIASHLTLDEAQVFAAFLDAQGVPAFVADVHLASPLFATFGANGVRIMVHEQNVALARQFLAGFKRGEYAVDEGADPDPA